MEFSIDRDIFLKSLSRANGIIEKKTTLPILSNILIDAKNSKVKITKLAQGLPVGGEIESLDDGTLFSAFKNRSKLNSNSG